MSVARERLEALYRSILGDESEEDPVRWQKRMRILASAKELFVQYGFRKTSVAEIAARAGVAKGTVYLYFPTKGDLLMQAVTLEEHTLIDRLGPAFDETLPGSRRLHFVRRESLEAMLDLPLLARLLTHDTELAAALSAADPEVTASGLALAEEWLAELIELAAPDLFSREEKLARARVIQHARYFASLMSEDLLMNGLDLRAMASTLADMVVYGAVHRPPDPVEEA